MSSCSGLYICMFYANSCILCSAQILIYILHSNRSSRFLLFITNCNSDNRKKGATFPFFFFFFALTELVCLIMAFTSFLGSGSTGAFSPDISANANQKDISGEAILCWKCHTDTRLSIPGNLF